MNSTVPGQKSGAKSEREISLLPHQACDAGKRTGFAYPRSSDFSYY